MGALVGGGHRPKDILSWSDTERAVATNAAMALESWRLEQVAEIMGAK